MNIQRLRNLTTRILHTKIEHMYEDIDYITGEPGVMTHMLSRACDAMQPYLRKVTVAEDRLWNGAFDIQHVGDIPIEPMNGHEKSEFFALYATLPKPLAKKNIIVV